jgi:hypothetical protein
VGDPQEPPDRGDGGGGWPMPRPVGQLTRSRGADHGDLVTRTKGCPPLSALGLKGWVRWHLWP